MTAISQVIERVYSPSPHQAKQQPVFRLHQHQHETMPSEGCEDDHTPSSWVPLENRVYRRSVLFGQLSWSLHEAQLGAALTAAAPNAGPIAIIPDGGWALSYALAVYSQAGRLIAKLPRLRERTVPPFRAVAVAWGVADSLCVVYNDGVIVRLPPDLQLSSASVVRAFPGAVDERVRDATIALPSGRIVMRTVSGKILSVDERGSVRTDTVIAMPPEDAPSFTTIATTTATTKPTTNPSTSTNNNTNDASVTALLVTANGDVVTTNGTRSYTLADDALDVAQIAVSANGLYVAALDATAATLAVFSADLKTQIARINLSKQAANLHVENVYADVLFDAKSPESIAWVGSDAVAVLYKEHVVLCGPRGKIAVMALDEACANCSGIILHTETDGLTVISASNAHFIQMVPQPVVTVRTNKQSPGFKLLNSYDSSIVSSHSIDVQAKESQQQQQQQQQQDSKLLSKLDLKEEYQANLFFDNSLFGTTSGKSVDTSGGEILKSSPSSSVVDSLTRYRLLRELRDSHQLLEGAKQCVQAAFFEFDVALQKRLVHAASYGIHHATVFDQGFIKPDPPSSNTRLNSSSNSGAYPNNPRRRRDELTKMSDSTLIPSTIAIIRVLNAVRTASGGMAVTKLQYDAMGLSAVVGRLSRYGEHTLALRLATFGGVSVYDVLSAWAATTIRTNVSDTDEALTLLIADRFETVRQSQLQAQATSSSATTPSILSNIASRGIVLPYVRAAEAALAASRQRCAELLLQREVRHELRVALYLKMGRDAAAILTAVDSGDPEVVVGVLERLFERMSVRDTARLIRASLPPVHAARATDALLAHLRGMGDTPAVRSVLGEAGRVRDLLLLDVSDALSIPDTGDYMAALDKLAGSVGRHAHVRKAVSFELGCVQHARTVAGASLALERKARLDPGTLAHVGDGELLARTVSELRDPTVRRDMVAKLRRDLALPDRRFFWACLEAHAQINDFDAVEALSYASGSGRPPPIGLMPFVDTCIKHARENEAVKYAMRMPDLRNRARALARCGRGREAADIAARLRNNQLLMEVQELAARHVANLPNAPVKEHPRPSPSPT